MRYHLLCNIDLVQHNTLCSHTQYMYAELHEKHYIHFINYLYIALDSFSIVNINLAGNMVWLICNKMQNKIQSTHFDKTVPILINLHTKMNIHVQQTNV